MTIIIAELKDAEIEENKEGRKITIKLTEKGGYFGHKTEIKMPAKSYEMVESAIVEKWLASINAM